MRVTHRLTCGLLLIVAFGLVNSQYPIAVLHGLGDSCSFSGLKSFTKAIYVHTGHYAECIESGSDLMTLTTSLKEQSKLACKLIKKNKNFQGDFSIVSLSQGALIGRYIIEKCDMKGKVKKFVSIGGPNAGTSRVPNCFNGIICYGLKKLVGMLVYAKFSQNNIGPAGYFRDNTNIETYLNYSNFLPDLNNEREFDKNAKARFEELERVILIKFEKDSMIYPKETAWFQYLDEDDKVVELNQTSFYNDDFIGLKKLNSEGKVLFVSVDDDHLQLSEKDEEKYIYQELK